MSFTSDSLPEFTGWVVAGRFRLDTLLGVGGYAKVYIATDIQEGPSAEKYAIKCMRIPPAGTQLFRALQDEIMFHFDVQDHPNVLSLHNVYNCGEYVFMVLSLCSSEDLFARVERQDFVNNSTLVRDTIVQLIDALEYCHSRGIYHRDLKLENVLFSLDGRSVLLADFGLASGTLACQQFRRGTPSYMSPGE